MKIKMKMKTRMSGPGIQNRIPREDEDERTRDPKSDPG